MSHIAEMLKIFDKGKKEPSKENKNEPKVKKLPPKKPALKIEEKPLITPKEIPKIIENSEILSKENSDMLIYKYPEIHIKNTKNILFIGNNPEQFINSFINIYRDICYEDKFRYKIEITDSNSSYKIYNIKARTINYDLKIITMISSMKNEGFIKDIINIINIFNKETIISFLNCIFITLENKYQLYKNGINLLLTLTILLKNANLKDKINIIYSSENISDNSINNTQEKNFNDIINEQINNIILKEYYNNASIIKSYSPKYFFIINSIMYEKNTENEWKKLKEEMKKIQNEIAKSIRLNLDIIDKTKVDILNDIFINNKISKLKLDKLNKNEQISLINLFINCYNNEITSNFILYLYNKIIDFKKEIKKSDKQITLVKGKNVLNSLNIYSIVKFPELRVLICNNCELKDNSLYLLDKLFSNILITLNLNNNKLSDISILNGQENLINLKELDLSYNNLINIESLAKCKLLNLINLNLSHNNIEDISCLENNLYFNSLEKLDLSFNKIKKVNKIDIKTLNLLNLLDNKISEGILDFNCFIEKLVLTKNNTKIYFKYYKENNVNNSETPFIDLLFLLEENNKNQELQNISFKNIKILEINGFDDLELLTNESLKELKIFNCKSNINDITIFNNIKFINIDEINFNNRINGGFNSLSIFKFLKINKIEVKEISNNNYICNFESEFPKINAVFSFHDLNFLKEQFLSYTKTINIDKEIIDNDKNREFFSYNNIVNSFPIFKNIKAERIIISNNNENKFNCETKFYNNLRFNFFFDDLKFIFDETFNKIKELKLSNMKFINYIGITKHKFPELSDFYLENSIIKSTEALSEIINIKSFVRHFYLNSNKFKFKLKDSFNQNKLLIDSITTNKNKIRINYKSPISFSLEIDKIEKIKNFKGCEKIDLSNLQLNDNDIICLENKTLPDLYKLNLNGNKITNLNFLKKININWNGKVSIKNNLINQGIEVIKENNNISLKNMQIKIKNDDENKYIISFDYSGKYDLCFDYFIDKNKNFDIFKNINFNENILILSYLKINNIDFLAYDNLNNLKSIFLDNNNIEDISLFEKIDYKINKIILKNNPIRKGLHVLKNKYFKCLYIELEIIKKENEYKICSNFIYPKDRNISLDFYINTIYELKSILDINNTYIKLINNETDELKSLEKEFLQNQIQSQEQNELFDIIILKKFFENHYITRKILFIFSR